MKNGGERAWRITLYTYTDQPYFYDHLYTSYVYLMDVVVDGTRNVYRRHV